MTTVEGLASGDGGSHPLQEAFLGHGAAQCGFCIPGQLVAARALLAPTPHPTRAEVEEGLAGNLCRCAGYEQIIEAVLARGRRRGREPSSRRRRPRDRRRRSPRRGSAALDRVTGRQAYVADIHLEDVAPRRSSSTLDCARARIVGDRHERRPRRARASASS